MTKRPGTVTSRIDGRIGWIVFDNPARLNAVSTSMYRRTCELAAELDENPEVRVIILRGEGEKAFVSGGDISEFEERGNDAAIIAEANAIAEQAKQRLLAVEKPVLAMIHGYCLGGGLALALCADIRFGSELCTLSIPAANRGLAYPPEGLKQLCDLVGPSVAKDIMFSARRLKADEACRIGLLNRVFPVAELERETVAYAELLAENAPLSIRASKICIHQMMQKAGKRDHALMNALVRQAAESEDFKEATRSFMEKRKPLFRGV